MLVFLLAFIALMLSVVRLFLPDGRLTAGACILLSLALLLGAYPHLGG